MVRVALAGFNDFMRQRLNVTWGDLLDIGRVQVGADALTHQTLQNKPDPETVVSQEYLTVFFFVIQLVTTIGGLVPANEVEIGIYILGLIINMTVCATFACALL